MLTDSRSPSYRSQKRIAADLPRGWGDLADQLKRASTSMPLTIAEGAGEFAPKDKAKFYRYARRSAVECAAAIDVAVEIDPSLDVGDAREKLHRIVSMVTKLALSCGAKL